jgi:hypothetical protein
MHAHARVLGCTSHCVAHSCCCCCCCCFAHRHACKRSALRANAKQVRATAACGTRHCATQQCARACVRASVRWAPVCRRRPLTKLLHAHAPASPHVPHCSKHAVRRQQVVRARRRPGRRAQRCRAAPARGRRPPAGGGALRRRPPGGQGQGGRQGRRQVGEVLVCLGGGGGDGGGARAVCVCVVHVLPFHTHLLLDAPDDARATPHGQAPPLAPCTPITTHHGTPRNRRSAAAPRTPRTRSRTPAARRSPSRTAPARTPTTCSTRCELWGVWGMWVWVVRIDARACACAYAICTTRVACKRHLTGHACALAGLSTVACMHMHVAFDWRAHALECSPPAPQHSRPHPHAVQPPPPPHTHTHDHTSHTTQAAKNINRAAEDAKDAASDAASTVQEKARCAEGRPRRCVGELAPTPRWRPETLPVQ